jgi:hypothetical protein
MSMRFKKFIIEDYRAITGPLTIDVSSRTLLPIIGINESGKTTILQALFAFDTYNDDLNDERHLKDTLNLYSTSPGNAKVTAVIECTRNDLYDAFDDVEDESAQGKASVARWKKRSRLPNTITITRDIKSQNYSIKEEPFATSPLADLLAREVIKFLPYILYFDDFRDKVDEQIEIPVSKTTGLTGWAATMQQLFRQTDESFSIFALVNLEERQRKSVLAKVQRHLNETLTRQWQDFRLDDSDALEIGLVFEAPAPGQPTGGSLRLEIVERDSNGDDHFFFISDRSKGFYWFFNFVMKLEFNPKVLHNNGQGSIYLLDEPGSYLHATAQAKLCGKLKSLSESNIVVYCTHSHYLLNPEVIPFSNIGVAVKDANGSISLVPIYQHDGNILERRSAFQPLIDALQIKPFMIDVTHARAVLVEGIYDYYALELFRKQRPVSVLPSAGADSVKFFVSLLIAWQIRFRALWDDDKAGRDALSRAEKLFGKEVAEQSFMLLPTHGGPTTILQNLFDGGDLSMIRKELTLSSDASFERTLAALFFSGRRAELLNKMSGKTQQNLATLWDAISDGL